MEDVTASEKRGKITMSLSTWLKVTWVDARMTVRNFGVTVHANDGRDILIPFSSFVVMGADNGLIEYSK